MYNPVVVEMYVKAKREDQWKEMKWVNGNEQHRDQKAEKPRTGLTQKLREKLASIFPDTWQGKQVDSENYASLSEEGC